MIISINGHFVNTSSIVIGIKKTLLTPGGKFLMAVREGIPEHIQVQQDGRWELLSFTIKEVLFYTNGTLVVGKPIGGYLKDWEIMYLWISGEVGGMSGVANHVNFSATELPWLTTKPGELNNVSRN